MSNKEVVAAVYPEIGLGRMGYAMALEEWLLRSGLSREQVEVVDVLGLSEREVKIAMLKLGYQVLSSLTFLYPPFRRFIDNRGDNGLVDPDVLAARFANQIVVSVSPLSCEMLSAAGVRHAGVVGDRNIALGYYSQQVRTLYVPDRSLVNGRVERVVETGGVLLPPCVAETLDWDERMTRLCADSVPRVGVMTHGAGEIGTVLSLVGLTPLLKDGRIHAAIFVGNHQWMGWLVEALAATLKIRIVSPEDINQDIATGAISIWRGGNAREAIRVRERLLPHVDLAVLASPQELSFLPGPVIVGPPRNDNERGNRARGIRHGNLIDRYPVHRLWCQIGSLLDDGSGGLNRAQEMLMRSRSSGVNFGAGAVVANDICEMLERR